MREPKIFLIGDTHFSHRNIIKYCNRPFVDVDDMNEQLIKNWNKVVGANDIVYVVGDFALCGKQKIIEIGQQLKGRKRLILGNHDQASIETYREAGFEFVYNHPIVLNDFFIVSHTPMTCLPSDGVYAQIFAHVHDDPIYATITPRSCCVSAERINYTPIEFEKVYRAMELAEEGEDEWLIK